MFEYSVLMMIILNDYVRQEYIFHICQHTGHNMNKEKNTGDFGSDLKRVNEEEEKLSFQINQCLPMQL